MALFPLLLNGRRIDATSGIGTPSNPGEADIEQAAAETILLGTIAVKIKRTRRPASKSVSRITGRQEEDFRGRNRERKRQRSAEEGRSEGIPGWREKRWGPCAHVVADLL